MLLACNERHKSSTAISHDRFGFELIDGLGSVSIIFPDRTDTFFSWIQRSDCGRPCEHGDYRFQSKRNRVFKESGLFWFGEPEDSVDQLSIYHQRPDTLVKNKDSLIITLKEWLRNKVLNDIEIGNVLSDTLVRIHDRYF